MDTVPASVRVSPGAAARRGRHAAAGAHRAHVSALTASVVAVSCLVGALVLVASGAADEPAGRVALHALVVTAPIAVGILAMESPRSERFGGLLVAAGVGWSVAALSESTSSVLYSVGRVAGWVVIGVVASVVLAFPTGRLTQRRDRLLVAAVAVVIGGLYVASAFVVDAYPEPSPWATCSGDCPANAFQVTTSQPAFIDAVLAPVRDVLAAALLLGIAASLLLRLRGSRTLRQAAAAAPVLAVGTVAAPVLAGLLVGRQLAPDSGFAERIALLWTLCLPGLAVAFSLGVLQRRLRVSNVLSGMAGVLSASLAPRQIGVVLRSALGDASAEVYVRSHDRGPWRRDDGGVVGPDEVPGPWRVLREIHDERGPIAAIALDAELDADDELVEAIVALVEAALREVWLRGELETSLSDLDDSRKRIATAADAERRRIERDLHDGAQQRLIALRMRLALAEELLLDDPAATSETIHELTENVDLALEDIRSLAHGIYPALLADRGLVDALRSIARRTALRVDVRASGVSRHPPEIESAVYFTCLEALQNVAKHATDVHQVRITLRQSAMLEVEVADDGDGFEPVGMRPGDGLRSMHDRVESLGGRLELRSAPGRGTRVRATIPLPARGARFHRASGIVG